MTISELQQIEIPLTTPALARLAAVRQGLILGKPVRQIARELECDEGTIRRDRKKLFLSPPELNQLLAGADYEPIKREKIRRQREAAYRRQEKAQAWRRGFNLQRESSRGYLNNALKVSILRFLESFEINQTTQLHILREVEKQCWYLGNSSMKWYIEDHNVAIAVNAMPKLPYSTPEFIEYMIFWLRGWLRQAEPDCVIRDRGIVKARQVLEKTCTA